MWALSKKETSSTFKNWRSNIAYSLSLNLDFSDFFEPGFTWEEKTHDNPTWGLIAGTGEHARTAVQRAGALEVMLGQIACWAPVVARSLITRDALSLQYAKEWGIPSGWCYFELASNESHEDLFQRMYAFVEDNLIERNDNRTHLGRQATDDKRISQSFLSVLVLQWLFVINKELPRAVTMKYAMELRNKTIASLRSEILIALPSILRDFEDSNEAKVMRVAFQGGKRFSDRKGFPQWRQPQKDRPKLPQCPLCKALGRQSVTHSLSTCRQLPEEDRKKKFPSS